MSVNLLSVSKSKHKTLLKNGVSIERKHTKAIYGNVMFQVISKYINPSQNVMHLEQDHGFLSLTLGFLNIFPSKGSTRSSIAPLMSIMYTIISVSKNKFTIMLYNFLYMLFYAFYYPCGRYSAYPKHLSHFSLGPQFHKQAIDYEIRLFQFVHGPFYGVTSVIIYEFGVFCELVL